MNLLHAVNIRHSSRTYVKTPVSNENIAYLTSLIKEYNKASGLGIRLVLNDSAAFDGFKKSYGMFSGVRNYIALIGNPKDPNFKEKTGYYGEKLILEATLLGLGTCWVGGTFDKRSCACTLADNECFDCVIVIGNVPPNITIKEKFISKAIHLKSKKITELSTAVGDVPLWFTNGIAAVYKAPSAINKKPVVFNYEKGIVTATVKNTTAFELVDLGIAKLHFEIGSGAGGFELGNGGRLRGNIS